MNSTGMLDEGTTPISLNGSEIPGTPFLSDELAYKLAAVIWFTMLPLSVLGIITNIINIRVFIEQGVRNDSTNIGFVCLSVWDLLGCATLIPYSLCYVVRYVDGLAQHLTCIAYSINFVYAHIAFQHMGTWTTVYISLIRCFCVLFPLKIKFMFSPKTTIFFISIVFIFFASVQTAYGLFTVLVWEFHPGLNITIAIARDTPSAQTYIYYKLMIINQILPLLAVLIVSINTALLARKLVEVKKWRDKNSSESRSEAPTPDDKSNSSKKPLASKEIELIKFINALTTIFLVCVLMALVPSIPVMVLPGVNFTGLNSNIFFILFFIRFLFDAVNSSINFFFYIRVSSRYRAAFHASFKMCSRLGWLKS